MLFPARKEHRSIGQRYKNILDSVGDADILMRMRSFITEHENGRHTSVNVDFDAGLHDINQEDSRSSTKIQTD